jgi:hypothetical protein
MSYVGKRFTTSNSVLSSLRAGSTVKVLGNGEVEVTFVAPEPITFKAGDRVRVVSKGRVGRIVRMTSVDGLSEQLPEPGEQLYVADGTFVVRIAKESDLQKY